MMNISNEELSSEEWKILFSVAKELKEIAPTEWYNEILFGVEIAGCEELRYCFLDNDIEQGCSFAVYQGDQGFRSYDDVTSESMDSHYRGTNLFNELHLLLMQNCLSTVFHNHKELSKHDLELIKSTGIKFRGKNAWPKLKNYQPGYVPQDVKPAEARLLTISMQQTVEFIKQRDRDKTAEQEENHENQFNVRKCVDGIWSNEWRAFPDIEEETEQKPLNEFQQAKLRHQHLPFQGVWQMDSLVMPPVESKTENGRGFFPIAFVVVDEYSELGLGFELLEPDKVQTDFIEMFIKIARRCGRYPEMIKMDNEELMQLVLPVIDSLDIELDETEELPELHHFLHSIEDYLQNS